MIETEKPPPEYKESQAPEEPIRTQPVQQKFIEQVVIEPVRPYAGIQSLCKDLGKYLGLFDCSCGSYFGYCWLSLFCVWIAGCCINKKIRWGNCTNAIFAVAFVIQVTTIALCLAALIISANNCVWHSCNLYETVLILWVITRQRVIFAYSCMNMS